MDALYFFRHSAHNDLELRFSLRSLERHMPWLRKVWVFGDRPEFLPDDCAVIEHVPHEYLARVGDFRTPITNFFLQLYTSSLIPGLSREYIRFSDDFVCLKDVTPDFARRARYIEDVSQLTSYRPGGLFRDSVWRTCDLLQRLGYTTFNFESHSPAYLTKKWVHDAWCDFKGFASEDRWFGILGSTAVLNHAHTREGLKLTQREQEGQWVGFHGSPPAFNDVVSQASDRTFLNFDDASFGPSISRFLNERFPVASRFERSSMRDMQMSNVDSSSPKLPPTSFVRRTSYPRVVLQDRMQFGKLLTECKLLGEGALVGVLDGQFAEVLLRDWRGRRLHCIDTWLTSEDDPKHVDKYNGPQWRHEHYFKEAHRRLDSFASRCTFHRMRPDDAAKLIPPRSLAFVYLDEKHYFGAVWNLLEIWSKKVRPGGILAGHDYLDGVLPSGHFEVKAAVDAWADKNGLQVECSGEEIWRSWIIRMPK